MVEDDPVVARMYQLTLVRHGFDVIVAADGEAGLRAAIESHPQLILLDIRLPKLDGIELLRRVKADEAARTIPVVMLSNYDDPALIASSRELGARDYLIKVNTNPTELPRLVAAWIEESR